jgi:hypothetical protein
VDATILEILADTVDGEADGNYSKQQARCGL